MSDPKPERHYSEFVTVTLSHFQEGEQLGLNLRAHSFLQAGVYLTNLSNNQSPSSVNPWFAVLTFLD